MGHDPDESRRKTSKSQEDFHSAGKGRRHDNGGYHDSRGNQHRPGRNSHNSSNKSQGRNQLRQPNNHQRNQPNRVDFEKPPREHVRICLTQPEITVSAARPHAQDFARLWDEKTPKREKMPKNAIFPDPTVNGHLPDHADIPLPSCDSRESSVGVIVDEATDIGEPVDMEVEESVEMEISPEKSAKSSNQVVVALPQMRPKVSFSLGFGKKSAAASALQSGMGAELDLEGEEVAVRPALPVVEKAVEKEPTMLIKQEKLDVPKNDVPEVKDIPTMLAAVSTIKLEDTTPSEVKEPEKPEDRAFSRPASRVSSKNSPRRPASRRSRSPSHSKHHSGSHSPSRRRRPSRSPIRHHRPSTTPHRDFQSRKRSRSPSNQPFRSKITSKPEPKEDNSVLEGVRRGKRSPVRERGPRRSSCRRSRSRSRRRSPDPRMSSLGTKRDTGRVSARKSSSPHKTRSPASPATDRSLGRSPPRRSRSRSPNSSPGRREERRSSPGHRRSRDRRDSLKRRKEGRDGRRDSPKRFNRQRRRSGELRRRSRERSSENGASLQFGRDHSNSPTGQDLTLASTDAEPNQASAKPQPARNGFSQRFTQQTPHNRPIPDLPAPHTLAPPTAQRPTPWQAPPPETTPTPMLPEFPPVKDPVVGSFPVPFNFDGTGPVFCWPYYMPEGSILLVPYLGLQKPPDASSVEHLVVMPRWVDPVPLLLSGCPVGYTPLNLSTLPTYDPTRAIPPPPPCSMAPLNQPTKPAIQKLVRIQLKERERLKRLRAEKEKSSQPVFDTPTPTSESLSSKTTTPQEGGKKGAGVGFSGQATVELRDAVAMATVAAVAAAVGDAVATVVI